MLRSRRGQNRFSVLSDKFNRHSPTCHSSDTQSVIDALEVDLGKKIQCNIMPGTLVPVTLREIEHEESDRESVGQRNGEPNQHQ